MWGGGYGEWGQSGVRGEEIKCATESVLWLSVLPASSERCVVFSVTVALGRTPTCTRILSLLDIYRLISPPLVVTLFILCFTRGKINLGKPKSFVISMGPTQCVEKYVCLFHSAYLLVDMMLATGKVEDVKWTSNRLFFLYFFFMGVVEQSIK